MQMLLSIVMILGSFVVLRLAEWVVRRYVRSRAGLAWSERVGSPSVPDGMRMLAGWCYAREEDFIAEELHRWADNWDARTDDLVREKKHVAFLLAALAEYGVKQRVTEKGGWELVHATDGTTPIVEIRHGSVAVVQVPSEGAFTAHKLMHWDAFKQVFTDNEG